MSWSLCYVTLYISNAVFKCNSPPAVENAVATSNATEFGSLVTYNCMPGYSLDRDGAAVCTMHTLQWINVPQCQGIWVIWNFSNSLVSRMLHVTTLLYCSTLLLPEMLHKSLYYFHTVVPVLTTMEIVIIVAAVLGGISLILFFLLLVLCCRICMLQWAIHCHTCTLTLRLTVSSPLCNLMHAQQLVHVDTSAPSWMREIGQKMR